MFVIALAGFLVLGVGRPRPGGSNDEHRAATALVPAISLFALLAGTYLALSISSVRLRLARAFARGPLGALAVPAILLAAISAYAAAAGLHVAVMLRDYGLYLFAPVLIALPRAGNPASALLAAAALWLPLEFRLLPPVPLPPVAGGFDASHLAGLVNGLCLFLVTRPLDGIGFTFLLRSADARRAVSAFLLYAIIALPVGLATAFLAWHPRLDAYTLAGLPWLIYLGTAIPEEFLFRGVIQNTSTRLLGPTPALVLASVVFGLAHLPDWRYVLLATFAGVAYGWVYLRTERITASAITHALVDWVWVLLLRP